MTENLYTYSKLIPIQFTYHNRVYDIKFKGRTLQIRGDSGIGKSLFVSDFAHMPLLDSVYKNSAIINCYTPDVTTKRIIKHSEDYNFIIIDNADIVITADIDDMIITELCNKSQTQWIFMGRKYFKSTRSLLFCAEMEVHKSRDNKFYFSVNYNV